MTLLVLGVMGMLFPMVMTITNTETDTDEITFSRITSIILFGLYFAFIYFQLFTHKELYESEGEAGKGEALSQRAGRYSSDSTDEGSGGSASSDERKDSAEDDEDEDEDILGLRYAILWLLIMTLFIAALSEILCDTITECSKQYNISGVFLSTIVLPIVGNAAEHAGAVMFSMKNKVDMAIGVAVGSSTQIALMVLPMLVLIGWVTGDEMSLNFHPFEGLTCLMTVLMVYMAIANGSTNWLVGLVLIAAYFILGVAFWVHTDEPLDAK
jgi:Ca2+:H+ antiporter